MAINLEDVEGLEADRKCLPKCVNDQSTRPCLNKKIKKHIIERGGKDEKK